MSESVRVGYDEHVFSLKKLKTFKLPNLCIPQAPLTDRSQVSRTSYWRSQPQPTPTRQVSPIQEQEKHFQEVDPSPSPPLDQPPPSADTELLAPKSASREARESSMGLEKLG